MYICISGGLLSPEPPVYSDIYMNKFLKIVNKLKKLVQNIQRTLIFDCLAYCLNIVMHSHNVFQIKYI